MHLWSARVPPWGSKVVLPITSHCHIVTCIFRPSLIIGLSFHCYTFNRCLLFEFVVGIKQNSRDNFDLVMATRLRFPEQDNGWLVLVSFLLGYFLFFACWALWLWIIAITIATSCWMFITCFAYIILFYCHFSAYIDIIIVSISLTRRLELKKVKHTLGKHTWNFRLQSSHLN